MQITSSSINTRFDKHEKTVGNTVKLYLQSFLRCEAEIKKLKCLSRTSLQPQPVNVVKTQSWIKLWNSISSCLFSFLFFKHPWKIFHSIHLFFLFFGLDTNTNMYLSSQIFFKTPHETIKFHENSMKNTFSNDLQTIFLQCLPWWQPTEPLNYGNS